MTTSPRIQANAHAPQFRLPDEKHDERDVEPVISGYGQTHAGRATIRGMTRALLSLTARLALIVALVIAVQSEAGLTIALIAGIAVLPLLAYGQARKGRGPS